MVKEFIYYVCIYFIYIYIYESNIIYIIIAILQLFYEICTKLFLINANLPSTLLVVITFDLKVLQSCKKILYSSYTT